MTLNKETKTKPNNDWLDNPPPIETRNYEHYDICVKLNILA